MTRLQHATTRLVDGSQHLATRASTRLTAWVRAGRRTDLTGWQAALGCYLRAGFLLGAAWLAWRAIRSTPALLWLIVPAWCVLACRAAPTAKDSPTSAEQPSETPAEDPLQGLTEGEFVAHLRTAIGGNSGAHLKALARHLTEATSTTWESTDIRAACEAAGVPVKDNVRMPGRNPSTGVRLSTLPTPSSSLAERRVGDVGTAGQESPTASPTPTPTGPAYEIRDDPGNPHRHKVHWPGKEVNGA